MCSHYEGLADPTSYRRSFGVDPARGVSRTDIWPGYESAFIRRPPLAEGFELCSRAVPDGQEAPLLNRQAVRGLFGLVPHWAADVTLAKSTYNARSESVSEKPSFRDAWRWAQHCIIPADSFFEPDWRSGRSVPTCIRRADGHPMGLAGLWACWKTPGGDLVHSFTMLTINADGHPLMRQFHKPEDEKRMVVVLDEQDYDAWLSADPETSANFLCAYPADRLVALALPSTAVSKTIKSSAAVQP